MMTFYWHFVMWYLTREDAWKGGYPLLDGLYDELTDEQHSYIFGILVEGLSVV